MMATSYFPSIVTFYQTAQSVNLIASGIAIRSRALGIFGTRHTQGTPPAVEADRETPQPAEAFCIAMAPVRLHKPQAPSLQARREALEVRR